MIRKPRRPHSLSPITDESAQHVLVLKFCVLLATAVTTPAGSTLLHAVLYAQPVWRRVLTATGAPDSASARAWSAACGPVGQQVFTLLSEAAVAWIACAVMRRILALDLILTPDSWGHGRRGQIGRKVVTASYTLAVVASVHVALMNIELSWASRVACGLAAVGLVAPVVCARIMGMRVDVWARALPAIVRDDRVMV